ncbi:MAG: Spy/CpxP family protein refolding chaperone [Azoarcus sp.]|jgi:hypothetical protein|nr:Spy/CpxP family protein refolding chaperone [Azoarcus sp.]
MQNWIKTSLIAALAASTLLGSPAVMAKGGQHHHQQAAVNPEQAKAKWLRQNEAQLARLELALVLTPEQKPAWETFKAAVTARNETVLNDMEITTKVGEAATVVERLKRAEEVTAQRSKLLGETRRDVEAFYVILNDTQKTVFDDEVYRLLPSRQGVVQTKKGKRSKK